MARGRGGSLRLPRTTLSFATPSRFIPALSGAPFNPYKLFQGVFAPYWILEHGGIGAGAKLCYVRLLGFAGKDARCFPSLEKLGKGLGVSDRQARDYVKELERAGLIAVEQRGLRKTNVYLFLWTAELDTLCNSMPDSPDDPDEGPDSPCDPPRAPKPSSGPIGINSEGISSLESSSSSSSEVLGYPPASARNRTTLAPEQLAVEESEHPSQPTNRTATMIIDWVQKRKLQRLRSDRHVGVPEKERLTEWLAIFEARGLADEEQIFSVLDAARAAADRCGRWRNWAFLTLQIQLSVERWEADRSPSGVESQTCSATPAEAQDTIWAKAKIRIRSQVPEIAFLNWFSCTRQIKECGSRIDVEVPDEPTRAYLTQEYHQATGAALRDMGISEVRFVVTGAPDVRGTGHGGAGGLSPIGHLHFGDGAPASIVTGGSGLNCALCVRHGGAAE
jgi:hypothetical protein